VASEIRTRRSFKKQPDFFGIPGRYIVPISFSLVAAITVAVYAGSLDPKNSNLYLLVGAGVGSVGLATWLMLMGGKPYKFQGTMQAQPTFVKTFVQAPLENPTAAQRIPNQISSAGHAVRPIEKGNSLLCYIDFQLKQQNVGAYLLRHNNQYKVVFGFAITPLSPNLSPDMYAQRGMVLEEGFKDLPKDENPTFVAVNSADCRQRLAELDRWIEQAPSAELKFLLSWEKHRVISLTRTDRHNPKQLRFYGTFHLGNAGYQPQDWLEKQIAGILEIPKLAAVLQGLNMGQQVSYAELRAMLIRAFERGYLNWVNYLTQRLELQVRPYSVNELWEIDWQKANSGITPVIPQVLQVSETDCTWQVNDPRDIKTWLFWGGAHTTDYQWLKMPGNGDTISVCVMDLLPNITWAGTDKDYQQFTYAAKALNTIPNSEVVVQLRAVNQEAAQANQMLLAKQSYGSMNAAANQGRSEIAAGWNFEEYRDTYESLRAGGHVVSFAWTGFVHRKSNRRYSGVERLAIDTATFCKQFADGTVNRDLGFVKQFWQEAQPWSWNPLLYQPCDRRLKDTTAALKGFIPLMVAQSRDTGGVEFIDPVGKTPLYVDVFKTPQHFLVVGGTGAGKSVLMWSGIIIQALALGMQVVIIDNTRDDGSGSFDAGTRFLNGIYYDVTQESHNIFEAPDWRKIADASSKRNLFEANLQSSLLGLAIPSDASDEKRADAKLILGLCLNAFWADAHLQRRYNQAHDAGFGSSAWQAMPTLSDFLDFLDIRYLPDATPDLVQALQKMRLRLTAFIQSPIGKALCQPSTFNSDNPLIVYALSNVKDDQEALPFALSARASAINRALRYGNTLVITDESSILLKNPSFAEGQGILCSQGRKSNIWVGMAGQSLSSINASTAARDILNNISIYFISRPGSISELAQEGIPLHLLQEAATRFDTDPKSFSKRWLISQPRDNEHWVGDFYPSFAALADCMNAGHEVRLKTEFSDRYADKFQCRAELAKHLQSLSYEANV
jgi:hypothetical protein